MTPGRWPVGRLAALLAILVGVAVVLQSVRSPRWTTVAPGVEFATLNGEPWCRAGSSTVALLRLDPGRVRIGMRHYTREPGRRPLRLSDWMERTGAIVAFNAGQYYPDLGYMGLFVSDGHVVSRRLHAGFRAALVAEPTGDSTHRARVIDLDREPLDARRLAWREVAQSFMLFERGGGGRVRKSEQVAARTAVAEDAHGRIVVATSEGGYTLWEFAQMLQRAPLELEHALSMDGGREAQLLVRGGRFRYASFGGWSAGRAAADGAIDQVPLPAVVVVTPR